MEWLSGKQQQQQQQNGLPTTSCVPGSDDENEDVITNNTNTNTNHDDGDYVDHQKDKKTRKMLGAEATAHIQQELSSKQPNKVISEFQKYHSLNPLFKKRRLLAGSTATEEMVGDTTLSGGGSNGEDVELWGLLGMLDLMGLTKADVNLSLLACLRNSLLAQIENLPIQK